MSDLCSSGQGLDSRGLEKQAGNALIAYVREAAGCNHTPLKPVPGLTGYLEGNRGTANHRLLTRAWRCGAAWRAFLYETTAAIRQEAEAATSWMVDWFEQQSTRGWMYRECLTTNHDQLYQLGVYGLRYLAWSYRSSVVKNLTQPVLEATGRHLRQARYLYDALSIDRHVMGPSIRCTAGGRTEDEKAVQLATVDVRTVCYAILGGWPAPMRILDPHRPIPGRPNDPNSAFWKYVYNVGAAYARQLRAEGDDLGGSVGEQPKLCNEMRVQRRGDDMIASFAHLTEAKGGVCWWAGRRAGQYMASPYQRSVNDEDCPFSIPTLPGATVTVIPGV